MCESLLIAFGVEVSETKFSVFLADFFKTKTTGHGHIDIQSLPTDAALLVPRHRVHVLHVIKAVKELDEQGTNIPDHCGKHLLIGRFEVCSFFTRIRGVLNLG